MTNRVRRDGAWARKSLSRGTRGWRECLARRSAWLASAGVRTPTARYDETTNEILFPWIEGVPGRRYFADLREGRQGVPPAVFVAALGSLAQLHEFEVRDAEARDLRLAPFDPWLMIVPRLDALPRDVAGAELRAAGRRVRAKFADATRALGAGGRRPVHGDFHVGQLMFERSDPRPWLLDLEHLALGHPESDLGNFIAHLVTSEDLYAGPPRRAFADLADLLPGLYAQAGGRRLDAGLVRAFGAVALFRRVLKLSGAGRGGEGLGAFLSTAEDLLGG